MGSVIYKIVFSKEGLTRSRLDQIFESNKFFKQKLKKQSISENFTRFFFLLYDHGLFECFSNKLTVTNAPDSKYN